MGTTLPLVNKPIGGQTLEPFLDLSMDATTGDWTLDSSRTRLHEYFLHRGIEVEYDMLEIGFPPDRVYQAQLEFEIDGKRYYSFYECDNKKMTQVNDYPQHNWGNGRG